MNPKDLTDEEVKVLKKTPEEIGIRAETRK